MGPLKQSFLVHGSFLMSSYGWKVKKYFCGKVWIFLLQSCLDIIFPCSFEITEIDCCEKSVIALPLNPSLWYTRIRKFLIRGHFLHNTGMNFKKSIRIFFYEGINQNLSLAFHPCSFPPRAPLTKVPGSASRSSSLRCFLSERRKNSTYKTI